MAVTTSTEMKIKLNYDDGDTRIYTIPGVSPSFPSASIKAAVTNFNERAIDLDPNGRCAKVFKSKDGGSCSSVNSVTIITTEEEIIYGN